MDIFDSMVMDDPVVIGFAAKSALIDVVSWVLSYRPSGISNTISSPPVNIVFDGRNMIWLFLLIER